VLVNAEYPTHCTYFRNLRKNPCFQVPTKEKYKRNEQERKKNLKQRQDASLEVNI
jgi:hypothetical protein